LNTKRLIKKYVKEICGELWPDIEKEEPEVNYPPEGRGDYAVNAAMKIAGKTKQNPLEIAEKIKSAIEEKEDINKIFEKIEVARPGFLNFYLKSDFLNNLIEKINKWGNEFGSNQVSESKNILVEFVSANPTGPVHLGNSRGGPFGDVLAGVLNKYGHQARREYYVNDYGNQIKILGHSILKDEEAQYRGDYIEKLSKENKETEPFLAGQKGARKIMEEIIKPSMQKLRINFDTYYSEEDLHQSGKVEAVLEEMKKSGLAYEKDKALWFKASEFGDEKDRVLKKSTGEMTYFGADIAYHLDKFERGSDLAINVWGADHHGDVPRMQGAMKALGFEGRLQILLTQFVKVLKDGKELKMSKRKGTYITIDDLMEEAGVDAVRFFFLMYSANTHMNFDLDLAREQSQKNPVYYVQYAYSRVCSILKKSKKESFEVERTREEIISKEGLKEKQELDLLKHLNKFPELVEEVACSYEVHRIPYYAMELADKFHSFYHQCKVLDKDNLEKSLTRLELVGAVKIVLKETLDLLGVEAPEKM
jgi:arginyl-tRNA synthetase